MADSVTTALITSIAAILVALVSATAAVISARRTNKAEMEFQAYRDALEEDRDKAMTVTQVLGQACSLIQKIRDQITDLSAEPDLSQARVRKISETCDEFVDLYSESHYMFATEERRRFHDIKNLAKSTAKKCNAILGGRTEMAGELGDFMASFDAAQRTMIDEYNRWQSLFGRGDEDERIEPY